MKTSRLLTNCIALSVLLGATMSCDQTVNELATPGSPTVQGSEKISKLLERSMREGSQDDYAAITAEYKSLTFNELELFNKVKTEIDQERIVQKLAQSGVQLTQTQRQTITGSLQQVNSLRTDVNKQSVALYGVPYNQIADSLLYSLLDQTSRNYAIEVPNFNQEPSASPNARAAQVMACSEADFPYSSTKLSGNVKWNYWGQKRTPGTSDCDYEFRYSGYLFRFYPKDWFAEKLCNSFNNAILRRSNNTYTRLLMGKWRVLFWEGDPSLTSVDMRG